MKRTGKKLLTTGLSMLLIAAQAMSVSADTDDDIAALQNQQAQTNAELSEVEGSINDMEVEKAAILEQISGYDQELVVTIAAIESLNHQVEEAEKALEATAKKLETSEQEADVQYDAMKKRIQYLYEEGGENGWLDIMLGEATLSEGMNNIDNTKSLYEYDRDELTAYTNTIQEVEDLQAQQTQMKAQLETMKQEQEGAKANLEVLKQQAQEESDDYEAQIAAAEEAAAQYYALIEQQNAQISELQAQKAAEEEAARKAAEEEAARKAAEEAAAAEAAEQAAQAATAAESASASTTQNVDTSGYTGEQGAQAAGTAAAIADGSLSVVDTSSGAGTGAGSATGQAVANFACQFVGNPYVWGGTSLTNGADCSGFVQSVYANFGISLSRTTYTQANEGIAVSYGDMQPGDVINYGFHTAIYIGNNQIVHAADSSLGIIIQSNPAFQPIVTIRRFV